MPAFTWGIQPVIPSSGVQHWGIQPYIPLAPQQYDPPDPIGIIEAITDAIGEADNEIAGFRMTRLSALTAEGATTFNVHSTLNWSDSGAVAIDGVKYYYSGKTNTTLTGITYIKNGVTENGAAADHRVNSAVMDITGEWSAIELLRRSILVDYAEGDDLDVVGRNINVKRLAIYSDDDQYRAMIKVLGYNPKGTIHGITLALDVLLGSGNWTMYEDILQYPCTIFVEIPSAQLLTDTKQGKAMLTGTAYGITGDGALSANEVALPANTLAVGSVKAALLDESFSFATEKPSATTYAYYPGHGGSNAFTYTGSASEATAVTVDSDGYCKFEVTSASATAKYRMDNTQGARITEPGYAEMSCLIRIPTGSVLDTSDYTQVSFGLCDNNSELKAGIASTPLRVTLYSADGSALGTAKNLDYDTWYEVTIKKYSNDHVELWVDDSFISQVAYSTIPANTPKFFEFGLRGSTSNGTEAHIKLVSAYAKDTIEHWSVISSGSVAAANPTRLTSGVSDPDFVAGDIGSRVITRDSGATNAQGGNNNGVWTVESLVDVDNIELVGQSYDDAVVATVTPNRITLDERTLVYPDDLGKTIVIEGTGVNAGSYTITELRDPDDVGTSLASKFLTPIRIETNVCEVSAGGFTNESGLSVHLTPSFVTEASLAYELCDAGSITGTSPSQVAELRGDNTLDGEVAEIIVTDVLSAQVLESTSDDNVIIQESPLLFEYYPFYLFDSLGEIDEFMDTITVSGVIPESAID